MEVVKSLPLEQGTLPLTMQLKKVARNLVQSEKFDWRSGNIVSARGLEERVAASQSRLVFVSQEQS
jgi:hypothetical protein